MVQAELLLRKHVSAEKAALSEANSTITALISALMSLLLDFFQFLNKIRKKFIQVCGPKFFSPCASELHSPGIMSTGGFLNSEN